MIAAVALYLLFAAVMLLGAILASASGEGLETIAFGGLVALILGSLSWRLLGGSRGAQISAIVISVLMAATTLQFPRLALFCVPIGLATLLLLTLPRSSREFFRNGTHGRIGHTSTAR